MTQKTDELKQHVLQQHLFMDMYCNSWRTEFAAAGGAVYCVKGCSSCCSLVVNCSLIEGMIVSDSLEMPEKLKVRDLALRISACAASSADTIGWLGTYRSEIGFCPFLDTASGACTVYDTRPLSCRALLSTKEPDWCSCDFGSLNSTEKKSYMDSLDPEFADFPVHYAKAPRETAEELEKSALRIMTASLGFSLTGPLPVMAALSIAVKGKTDSVLSDTVSDIIDEWKLDTVLMLSFRTETQRGT